MMRPRRKKWTEEEERTLIDKYGEMISDGILAKMKTREKKFRPIAAHVNSIHHARDPVSFPWQWSWKDVSTKVQNMRHQYLLVKQKIKRPASVIVGGNNSAAIDQSPEEFDWGEGLTHWPNFLKYKDVFGDLALVYNNNDSIVAIADGNGVSNPIFAATDGAMNSLQFGHMGPSSEGNFGVGIDGSENGVLGLGMDFEYDGEEGDENNNNNHLGDGEDGFDIEELVPNGSELRKKRKKSKEWGKQGWSFLANQLTQLREREARFEEREAERERERKKRDKFRMEIEQERDLKLGEREDRECARENMRSDWIQEWETIEKESADRERQRREDELKKEREWEEKMEMRRLDWKKRTDDMLSQHRGARDQIQSRFLHGQQTLTSQLLGTFSQWTAHPTGLSDHTTTGNPYLSQMMQNMHHVNGIVHDDNRVEGDNQDDEFIIDG